MLWNTLRFLLVVCCMSKLSALEYFEVSPGCLLYEQTQCFGIL